MGISEVFRTSLQTSNPSFPGRFRSRIIRSGDSLWNTAKGFDPISGGDHPVAILFQVGLERFKDIRLIIDDKDLSREVRHNSIILFE